MSDVSTPREPHLAAFREHAQAGLEPVLVRPPATTGGSFDRMRDAVDRVRDDPRLGALVLAGVALVAGILWYRTGLAGAGEPVSAGRSSPPTSEASPPTTGLGDEVVVHVSGAVVTPGVYRLSGESRVGDAVDQAGGAAPGADVHRINLAARLADGQRVHVPLEGEPLPPDTAHDGGSGATGGGLINVNLASASELESLPGVGPAIARAIIDERERRGGFRSVDDLLRVKGIGEARLADLRPLVTV